MESKKNPRTATAQFNKTLKPHENSILKPSPSPSKDHKDKKSLIPRPNLTRLAVIFVVTGVANGVAVGVALSSGSENPVWASILSAIITGTCAIIAAAIRK